ncbi:hypothetical protein MnBA_24250 [Marinobacterium sp. BA1]
MFELSGQPGKQMSKRARYCRLVQSEFWLRCRVKWPVWWVQAPPGEPQNLPFASVLQGAGSSAWLLRWRY